MLWGKSAHYNKKNQRVFQGRKVRVNLLGIVRKNQELKHRLKHYNPEKQQMGITVYQKEQR